jgi:hypothetical protein
VNETGRLNKLIAAVKAAGDDPKECQKVISSYLAEHNKNPSRKTDKERAILAGVRALRDLARLESRIGQEEVRLGLSRSSCDEPFDKRLERIHARRGT